MLVNCPGLASDCFDIIGPKKNILCHVKNLLNGCKKYRGQQTQDAEGAEKMLGMYPPPPTADDMNVWEILPQLCSFMFTTPATKTDKNQL